ncbi:MAG: SDR family NAD(P)-dependent oxidoreductase [Dokdonella sp.]
MRILFASLLVAVVSLCLAGTSQPASTALSYAGKTVLVTGSTDGLGRELARALAADGARVIVHGRNAERGKALVEEINAKGKGSAHFIAADFSSLDEVKAFAATITRDYPTLDLLVNNAGIASSGEQPRRISEDGHELQFAVNYLAGWILVNALRPSLEAAAPSRIINVASGSAYPIDFDDVMLEKPGAHARGYGQSKLAQVTMTAALAPSFEKSGITMIALHPATRMDTTMVRGLGVSATSTVAEGRDHVMGLITASSLQAGAFYRDSKPVTPHAQAADIDARAKLVALSESLTGVATQ